MQVLVNGDERLLLFSIELAANDLRLVKKSRIKDAAKKVLEVFRDNPAYVYEC